MNCVIAGNLSWDDKYLKICKVHLSICYILVNCREKCLLSACVWLNDRAWKLNVNRSQQRLGGIYLLYDHSYEWYFFAGKSRRGKTESICKRSAADFQPFTPWNCTSGYFVWCSGSEIYKYHLQYWNVQVKVVNVFEQQSFSQCLYDWPQKRHKKV